MAYQGTAFDLSNDVVFNDPNQGGVTGVHTSKSNVKTTVRLLDLRSAEADPFGQVVARTLASNKLVRISELPDRPEKGSEFSFGGKVWLVASAEPDHEELNWRVELDLKRVS